MENETEADARGPAAYSSDYDGTRRNQFANEFVCSTGETCDELSRIRRRGHCDDIAAHTEVVAVRSQCDHASSRGRHDRLMQLRDQRVIERVASVGAREVKVRNSINDLRPHPGLIRLSHR
jgi:hypothetical protein